MTWHWWCTILNAFHSEWHYLTWDFIGHQGSLLSPCYTRVASSRWLHGAQEKLRTLRCAQWDFLERWGIDVASPWHLHWTPWGLLGRHATARTLCMQCVPTVIWMSAMRTPWVRSGNAVTAQWGLLERRKDALHTQRGCIWSPQERRCRQWRLHGDPTECMETSLHLYRILTVHLRRLHCA